ncbi:MAG: PAS domain S-box protein [Synergistaceae bacterium]|nr:PAS domain S-box protein [Synergistaceae bacterium]
MTITDFSKNFSYRTLFENVFDPIAVYRVEDGNIIFIDVNPAYERVMKLKRENIIGRTFDDVWPYAEARWEGVIRQCLAQKRSMHCIGESSDVGSYLEAVAFPIPPDMAAVVFLDRTKLRRSENTLRKRQAQLRELAAKLTLIEENTRRGVASELHDRVGYDLICQLRMLRELEARDDTADIKPELDALIKNTESIIAGNRSLIFELSPPVLKEAGLNPALDELAQNILAPHGIKWHIITKGSADEYKADDSVCIILYRMARELLINAVKHSKASEVNIIINRKPEIITVAVEDNGTGLQGSSKGFGLFSIKERLLALGGNLKIISEQGKGLMAVMTCPLKMKKGEILHDDKNTFSGRSQTLH